jgi:putative N6-adenine-specific DNA methylase
MGITGAKPQRLGIRVSLNREEVYRVVYGSRLASKVLRPLATFECRDPDELYTKAYGFNWSLIVKPDQTIKVTASVSDSSITHSQYAALKLKDAIVDSLRDTHGVRPSVDKDRPDIRLDLHLRQNEATVSLYYSDGVLHRRGYRKQTVEAPIKENLAAGILRLAGWNTQEPLWDIFCGSGTFLIEAAMMATRTPAGYYRKVQGFETLADFDPDTWEKVRLSMDDAITVLPPGLIAGSDLDARALAATRANLETTAFAEAVRLTQREFSRSPGPFKTGLVLSNPPYGVRLGESEEALFALYRKLGRFMQIKLTGTRACLIVPHPELGKAIGVTPVESTALDNGPLEVWANVYRPPMGAPNPPVGG